MRFRKGDKVEILDKKEVPVSWRIAEILSGNGRNYQVQYNPYPAMAREQFVGTISSELVRPCPPLVQGVENCVPGDIVEVFYEFSWKICTVLKILGGKKRNKSNKIHLRVAAFQNQYLVRLLGLSQELVFDQSNIRMRQTWHGDRWILMRKSSRGGEDVIVSKAVTSNSYRMNFQVPQCNGRAKYQPRKVCVNNQDDEPLRVSPVISSRSLKRMSPYCASIDEAHGRAQKVRAIQKDVGEQRLFATPVLEKVDAVSFSYPRDILGEKNTHASFNVISNGYNQMEKGKQSDYLDCSGIRSSEVSNFDSDACSVGSCSVTNQCANNCYSHLIPHCQDTDTLCSDAESCYCSISKRKSYSLPPKELEVSIRRLELHAYRRTLEALYASGPLSWEQEALLTNLRIMLHISNDEHLMELKHLIPAKTAIVIQ